MNEHTFISKTQEIQNLLYSFALRLTKSREGAEDLVQETYFRAFKARESFQEGTNFKSWVTTIMHHAFINDYRKSKVRRHINGVMPDMVALDRTERGVESNAEASLSLNELTVLIRKLDTMYSMPFMMFYQGFEYSEIATHLRLPIGTVKSRIFVARAKLKALIGSRQLA
ncbi:RNA polymerase sigma factor [Neolewinella persica]|uniref:RNA polymerase sigma factor n=1 Tax=Neolewinella persica TaxID=70998 RepID=UPI00037C8A52|nr:RNA polymerase sigma factor [Neolewinella persica]